MNRMEFNHWKEQRRSDGITWLSLDEGAKHVLTAAVMRDFAAILDRLDADPPKGLVIDAGFIAGGDIEEFSRLDTAEKARAVVARGWDLCNRLAAVRYPTLALIRGHCLGGGLELALACRYRIAVELPETKMGLPEVMLGIFPGWGGMKRLPEVVGAPAALDMMLTGKTVDARKAKAMGLVDLAVAPRVMEASAAGLVLSGRPPRRVGGVRALLGAWPLKGLVAAQARRQVAARVRPEHYPAPWAIIDLWAHHGGNALAAPHILERIIASPAARNLMRVFFLQERLKSFGKRSEFRAGRVHVVGAGVMGGDIAAWCALRGLTVTLQDQGLERIAPAVKRAHQLFAKRLKEPRLVRAAFDRLVPDPEGRGVAQADVVIEAIVEDLAAKRSLLAALEPRLKPDAVLATNTSSLRLEDLRVGLERPGRLVGIHFFNPVAQMPLVEVVEAAGADARMLERASAFVHEIGKLPLPVRSAPGFLVNAVLAPYLLEAIRCVDEGVSPETVDCAMLSFGMPMGPIELADTVGLDIALAAGRQLTAAQVPAGLAERVQRGDLGRKSGRGFYTWREGKAQKGDAGAVPPGLTERLVGPLIERTRRLVEEGVVADADLADAGVIFGTGFAPFTGGPLKLGKA